MPQFVTYKSLDLIVSSEQLTKLFQIFTIIFYGASPALVVLVCEEPEYEGGEEDEVGAEDVHVAEGQPSPHRLVPQVKNAPVVVYTFITSIEEG